MNKELNEKVKMKYKILITLENETKKVKNQLSSKEQKVTLENEIQENNLITRKKKHRKDKGKNVIILSIE